MLDRVTFGRGRDVCIMVIDGTWRRDRLLQAVADTGALRRTVEGSIQGLNLREFFLLPSSNGLAYRVANSSGSTAPTWTSVPEERGECEFHLKFIGSSQHGLIAMPQRNCIGCEAVETARERGMSVECANFEKPRPFALDRFILLLVR